MRDLEELIRLASDGDRRAFDELVEAKREQIVRIAYQVTGDLADAQDVAQTVLLRLWQVLRRYDPGRRFDTWLYRITVNAAIDQLRSSGPKGWLQPLPADTDTLGAAGGATAEERIDRKLVQRAFLRLAARLAPKQRAVFVLREIEGLDTATIATTLGVRESTVRNHLLHARRILRDGLEREYPDLIGKRRGPEGERA
jgi:RNA polymerase sigma-70 factor (ECF subfamily)